MLLVIMPDYFKSESMKTLKFLLAVSLIGLGWTGLWLCENQG